MQADGGTRTAAITGGFVALCLAVKKLLAEKTLVDSPVIRQVAAGVRGASWAAFPRLISTTRWTAAPTADVNVVMTRQGGSMAFAEIQGTGEGRPYSRGELNALLDLAQAGVERLMAGQLEALGEAADVIGRKPVLALATGTRDLVRELRAMLGDKFDVRSMREMGVETDVEETGATFEENALIKAEALMRLTGCAALADDSGLMVDALGGRPGVYSARYCGVHGDDEANNQLLLRELENVPEPRTARYAAAVALCRPGRAPLVTYGTCEGEILRQYRGEGGFGYDPLFYSEDLHMTLAEAAPEAKNAVSHRARAVEKLLKLLEAEDV